MLLWRFSNLIHLFLFNLFRQAPIDGFSDDFWKSEKFWWEIIQTKNNKSDYYRTIIIE